MKYILIFLCLCIGSTLMAQNANSIQEAMADYDYEKAIELINKEVPAPHLLVQKAKALKGLNRTLEALSTFQQIIAEQPASQQILIETAECCRSLAKNKEALTYYQQALELNPNNTYARLQYIKLLCNQGKYQDAFNECSSLARTDSSATVLRLKAESQEGMQQMIEAMKTYTTIISRYPSDYLSCAKLSRLFIDMEKYDYAIMLTEEFRKNDSTNVEVNRQNAMAHCLKKDYPTAVKRYEDLTIQGDSTLLTCYYLGVSFYATEKYYDAHNWLEKALAFNQPNANLLYYLGRSCSKTSWKQEGVEYLQQALDLTIPKDSTLTRLYHGLADCYGLAQRFPEKIQTLTKQYKYDPANHMLLYNMGFISEYGLKDVKAAERYYEAFLKTKPKNKVREVKTEEQEVDYYVKATKRLEVLRKEKFFKEGIPKQQ